MYGTQTMEIFNHADISFENDVKMYGTQTRTTLLLRPPRLRMM